MQLALHAYSAGEVPSNRVGQAMGQVGLWATVFATQKFPCLTDIPITETREHLIN